MTKVATGKERVNVCFVGQPFPSRCHREENRLIIFLPRFDKTCLQGFSATETSYKIEISLVASRDMILSNKPILRCCADWSAPLLFANPRRQVFSSQSSFIDVGLQTPKIKVILSIFCFIGVTL